LAQLKQIFAASATPLFTRQAPCMLVRVFLDKSGYNSAGAFTFPIS